MKLEKKFEKEKSLRISHFRSFVIIFSGDIQKRSDSLDLVKFGIKLMHLNFSGVY